MRHSLPSTINALMCCFLRIMIATRSHWRESFRHIKVDRSNKSTDSPPPCSAFSFVCMFLCTLMELTNQCHPPLRQGICDVMLSSPSVEMNDRRTVKRGRRRVHCRVDGAAICELHLMHACRKPPSSGCTRHTML